MQATTSWISSYLEPRSAQAAQADEVVPRSTAAMIGDALRAAGPLVPAAEPLVPAAGPLVPAGRYRYGSATPEYAGLTSPQALAARERMRQAEADDRVARSSLLALTPRMALADMRAAAVGSGDDESGAFVLRGLAMWCLLAALLVASMKW